MLPVVGDSKEAHSCSELCELIAFTFRSLRWKLLMIKSLKVVTRLLGQFIVDTSYVLRFRHPASLVNHVSTNCFGYGDQCIY